MSLSGDKWGRRMIDRHQYRRYATPERRHNLSLWLAAPTPARNVHYESFRGQCIIRIRTNRDKRYEIQLSIPETEVLHSWRGWRWLMAQMLREMRLRMWYELDCKRRSRLS